LADDDLGEARAAEERLAQRLLRGDDFVRQALVLGQVADELQDQRDIGFGGGADCKHACDHTGRCASSSSPRSSSASPRWPLSRWLPLHPSPPRPRPPVARAPPPAVKAASRRLEPRVTPEMLRHSRLNNVLYFVNVVYSL